MRKNYALFIIFLISLFYNCQNSYSQSASQKLILNPSMVTNESAYGDPGMLVDEQAIANDPLNGAGGAPETNWFPGWGDKNPASAYIDLGTNYDLSHILIYDTNGVGDFIVEYGEPGNWIPAFTEPLTSYLTWKKHDVTISTRYLRFTRLTGNSNAHEIVLYGSVSNTAPTLNPINDQEVTEGANLSINLSATDVENDGLTYSLNSTVSFASLTDNGDGSAVLEINPASGTSGSYVLSVLVTDEHSASDEQSFTQTVNSQATRIDGKLSLNPSMMANESAYGDPGMLVDEQAIANDPLNGAGGAPETNWFPGWGDKNPASAYIDLGTNYDLSHVLIYDTNGVGDFIVEYGEPGNWIPAFTEPLTSYLTWKKHDVTISTRYLRFTRLTGNSNAHEIVLYGSMVSNSAPVLEIIENQTIIEGGELSLPLSAADPNNSSLTYSLITTAEFITLNDNGDGTATLNVHPPTGSAGVYAVAITVTNSSGGQTTESFDLAVESSGIEDPPSSDALQVIGIDFHDWRNNTPSSWNGLSDRNVGGTVANLKNQEGQVTNYSITVTDHFNGTGLSNLSTGNDSGPVPDGVMSTFWYNQYNQGILKFVLDKSKKYTFRIYGGRDGTNDDKSADYTIGDQTVSLYNFNNTQNEAVIHNVIPNANNEVLLSVTNSTGYTYAILNGIVIEEYAVENANVAPVLALIGSQTVKEGEQFEKTITATDADSDSLIFSLSTIADFINLNESGVGSATLKITPGYLAVGDYPATIKVDDGSGGIVSETFTITVSANPGGIPQEGILER